MRQSIRHRIVGAACLAAALVVAHPVAAQTSQSFSCTESVSTFTVPDGVTSLTALVQGAHGGNPGNGKPGGYGGSVQATLPVSPGQTLYIWVGCIDQPNEHADGYGTGGDKGSASCPQEGSGGQGGGGSAITLDYAGNQPLIVAGGGGGGGGDSDDGGIGGNGGSPAQSGQDGNGPGGYGGCGGCTDNANGGNGQGSDYASCSGGGGGGGGGFRGGAGGQSGDYFSGGGGGGGGQSFAASTAQYVTFGTSQLGQSGLVTLSWSAGAIADADADGVPDEEDTCSEDSDRSPTVLVEACDTGVRNELDTDGCTIADRIAEIASSAKNHRQFVRQVTHLARQGFITANDENAIRQCLATIPAH
jgi:hypothetical protein